MKSLKEEYDNLKFLMVCYLLIYLLKIEYDQTRCVQDKNFNFFTVKFFKNERFNVFI